MENIYNELDMTKCFEAGVKFARDMMNNPSNSEYMLIVKEQKTKKDIKYEELKAGDLYLYKQDNDWIQAKIFMHWRGSPMVELLEGRLKGKHWYLFPDSMNKLKHI